MTPKQEAFVREYLIDLNATQAAIRAGYSAKTAEQQGNRLLGNVQVAKAVAVAQKARANRLEITADRVLLELARIAFFDPRKMMDEQGRPRALVDLDDDTAAVVAGLEVLEEYEGHGEDRVQIGHVKKYKIADKNTALTNAMRHLGMLRDRVEVADVTDRATALREAWERVEARRAK